MPITSQEVAVWEDIFVLLKENTVDFTIAWVYDDVADPPEYVFTHGNFKHRFREEPYGAVTNRYFMNINRILPAEVDYVVFESHVVASNGADVAAADLFAEVNQQVNDTLQRAIQVFNNDFTLP